MIYPISDPPPSKACCYLHPLLPPLFTLILNRQPIAGAATHRHISPLPKCPAKINASQSHAHVCHSVITMASITLTPPPSCISLSESQRARLPHPMSERDYSWQLLSLHTISPGANKFFSLFSAPFLSVHPRNTPLSSPRPPLVRIHHSKLDPRPIRPHFRPLHASHYFGK
jgi:hypothetical protein